MKVIDWQSIKRSINVRIINDRAAKCASISESWDPDEIDRNVRTLLLQTTIYTRKFLQLYHPDTS